MRWVTWVATMAAGWASAALAGPGPMAYEEAVLAEINFVRAHPQELAAALRRYREGFTGRIVREQGNPVGVLTQEGPAAVDEAIAFLERQVPLPPLAAGPVLARAARGWAADQGRAGSVGHGFADGASPGARVRAAGGDIYVGETISYGMRTPAAVVRQLVVDDGVAGRGHRALVFSAGFRFAGVGCGGHARYGSMCVVDYAGTPDGAAAMMRVAAVQPSRASAFSR